MIDKKSSLSIVKQCKILNLNRSSLYYCKVPESPENLDLMKLIDRIHLEYPFYGIRRIQYQLKTFNQLIVNRKRIRRLMQLMCLETIYPKPKTTKRGKDHKIYPYLLSHLIINRANQVWCTDITYVPMDKGVIYLVAIMDWYSRKVLSYRVSNTMDSSFCIDALEDAISRFGPPEIFNSDQGSQFTDHKFTGILQVNGIKISMDGKGAWRDNVIIERFWRSLKYEEVYLKAYKSMKETKKEISKYISFYNTMRPHQSFENKTPDCAYHEKSSYKAA